MNTPTYTTRRCDRALHVARARRDLEALRPIRLTGRGRQAVQACVALLWSLAFMAGVFLPFYWTHS